nr:hypothetical protein [Tanacetum cinerariifolium]
FSSLFRFDHRLKTLEANFSEFMQTNQFARAVSSILKIVQRNMDQRINEAVKVAVQIQSKRLRNEAQAENDEFLKTIDENMQKIIKERRDDDVDKRRRTLRWIRLGVQEMKRRKGARVNKSSESATAEEPMETTFEIEEPSHPEFKIGRKRQQFYGFAFNRESSRDVYSKRRIIAVTELKIVEWHNYKYLDWITVRRDDDKLYKFKEGDFKRLCIQDIEDMLLLLVQGKLTNFTIKERFAFNVSLRMFTRGIVIQRRVEDLQLGVESYQKKLNLTRSDTYCYNLKRKQAYIAYSKSRGFIDQDKDKQNRLMQIDELYKFSDGTLTDRKSDKERAAAMIQAIDKKLNTMRIMRSLERFVGRRLYEGDFRMLQRTI